jgi:uncharacterized protein YcnI
MSHLSRTATRLAAVAAGATTILALGTSPAAAHVTVTPTTTDAGAYTVLTFSVGHGCEGSPTTEIAIRMPEEIIAVTPTINPTWGVEKAMETLDEPVDNGHGGTYTERVAEVVYTADEPLADGFRETFQLSLQLTAEEGETLVFPVLQTCAEGETAWAQTYEEGQEEPEHPAPLVVVTAGSGDGHGAAGGEPDAEQSHGAAASAETDDSSDPVGWIGLALGALGLAAGGTALARSRR